jgi:phosphoribosylaminoimidazole-succinocarboxamide synthase
VLALPHLATGKVREIYQVDDDLLLIVATDRISAYDAILTPDIPDKGRVLTGISLFFFRTLETPNHLVTADLDTIECLDADERRRLGGRAMIVRRATMLPVECAVRGYLYGSAWREYAAGGGPTTEHLPAGLMQGDLLPEPVFTPATKAESGHDENLTEAATRRLLGDALFEEVRRRSIDLYTTAAGHARECGLILADTKLEFGTIGDDLVLADEVFTPDSSRYWPADAWSPGGPIPSFDKQYVRDWLDTSGWDHTPPAPPLPVEVVAGTRARYVEAFERITGQDFASYLNDATRHTTTEST